MSVATINHIQLIHRTEKAILIFGSTTSLVILVAGAVFLQFSLILAAVFTLGWTFIASYYISRCKVELLNNTLNQIKSLTDRIDCQARTIIELQEIAKQGPEFKERLDRVDRQLMHHDMNCAFIKCHSTTDDGLTRPRIVVEEPGKPT